jgi:hypothetical protein
MPKKSTMVAEIVGVGSIGTAVGTITGYLSELSVDPAIVEQIHDALTDAAELLRDDRFARTGAIERTSFGACQSGQDLSYHHGRAHQVMADTLVGVTQDLEAFAISVKRAAEDLAEADATAVQDLKKRATTVFSLLGAKSFADAAYDRSRNNVRDPFRHPGRGR